MNAYSILVVAVLVTACRRDAPTTTSSTSTTVVVTSSAPIGEYTLGQNGAQTITIDGVHIETAPDLPARSSTITVDSNSGNQTTVILQGWSIRVDAGRVHVADRDYGSVASGDTVRLAKDGVHVGTELRGPLP